MAQSPTSHHLRAAVAALAACLWAGAAVAQPAPAREYGPGAGEICIHIIEVDRVQDTVRRSLPGAQLLTIVLDETRLRAYEEWFNALPPVTNYRFDGLHLYGNSLPFFYVVHFETGPQGTCAVSGATIAPPDMDRLFGKGV